MHAEMKQMCSSGSFVSVTATPTIIFTIFLGRTKIGGGWSRTITEIPIHLRSNSSGGGWQKVGDRRTRLRLFSAAATLSVDNGFRRAFIKRATKK